MGGGYSLDVALQEPTLAADVINYGHLATDTDALKKINAPILGLFGGQDHGITPDDVKKFGAAMEQLGKKDRYQDLRRRRARLRKSEQQRRIPPADAADAWQRTVDFLAQLSENKFFESTRHRVSPRDATPWLFTFEHLIKRLPVRALKASGLHEFLMAPMSLA
jgi:hypothetical protein